MNELIITVKIDGEKYTEKQLARYQYERTLHALHELKGWGVDVKNNGKSLSHIDINWLEPQVAEAVLLETKLSLGSEKMVEVFQEAISDSERRWREYSRDFKPENCHVGVTEIRVKGVSYAEAAAVIGGASDTARALAAFPEHYIVQGDITKGQQGMEVFGCFGEPVLVHGTAVNYIPAGFPFEKDPDYPVLIFGEMLLLSDDTNIHVGACHMFKPEDDGFAVKSICFCPEKAPKAIADGHKIHFAVEIANSAKIAFANKQN